MLMRALLASVLISCHPYLVRSAYFTGASASWELECPIATMTVTGHCDVEHGNILESHASAHGWYCQAEMRGSCEMTITLDCE